MFRHNRKVLYIILPLTFLAACSPGQWPGEGGNPTPTVEVARFSTPTATALPITTPTSKAPEVPTGTPTARPTPTAEATSTVSTPTEIEDEVTTTPTSEAIATPIEPPPSPPATPTETAAPPLPAPAGRIAFPVDDGGGHYDVWIVELPAGEPFLGQARARQPNFSSDGRLLVKAQGNDLGESIALLDANYTWLGIINESPEDSYPFWHPNGMRYTYSNSNLAKDPDTAHLAPYIFNTCSLQIPRFEEDIKCRDTLQWGKIEVGEAPVWTEDDRIAFFSYKGDDGIYFVKPASVLRDAGGLGPKQLLVRSNGLPTDTAGNQLFFSAGDIDGNWEAYAIDLDGANLTNLSRAPHAQDGLPAVSPDGDWVAFVSDRDGRWGIWIVPRRGGDPVKVVDISNINTNPSPWGTGNRVWMTERISWGP